MTDATIAARRAELDERQAVVAALLAETRCEQLLILEPPNLAWFSGSPLSRGALDPAEQPALIVSANQRWVVCSNVDSHRLFETHLDDLGFQLKEWPWHAGRDQLLADLCEGRQVACDRHVRDSVPVSEKLRQIRLVHGTRALALLRDLGRYLARALEATARNVEPGETEAEAAGHVAHRLLRRGIDPIAIHAAADFRDVDDARPGFSDNPIQRAISLTAVGRRDGLHIAAGRTVWFHEPDAEVRNQFEAAGAIAAGREMALAAGRSIAEVFQAGQKIAEAVGAEHAWRSATMGHFTGWLPVEQMLTPTAKPVLLTHQAVTLQTRVGAGATCDSYLITESGCERLTSDDEGPLRRYRFGSATLDLPDVIRR